MQTVIHVGILTGHIGYILNFSLSIQNLDNHTTGRLSEMKAGKPDTPLFFMREAIDLAKAHMELKEGGPFGAVIVKDNTIVGRGWNRVTSTNDPTAHAEIVCIRDACNRLQTFDLSGCTLYVNCEPCPMCLAAVYWARIETVYYGADKNDAAAIGFDDAEIYREIKKDIGKRKMQMIQLLPGEAAAGLRLWENLEGKTVY